MGPEPHQHRDEAHPLQRPARGQAVRQPGKTLCDDTTFLAYLRQCFVEPQAVAAMSASASSAPTSKTGNDTRSLALHHAVAQLNLTVGDLDGNVRQMTTAARQAWEQQADVVVFSELALTGYYPGDLLTTPPLQRTEAAFHGAAAGLAPDARPALGGGPAGCATPGPGPRPAQRAASSSGDGDILLTCAKQLPPTYNVFDERRHFEPGPDAVRLLVIRGVRSGFLICEDGWNDSTRATWPTHSERLRDAAPDLVVSINASPSNIGKRRQRHDVLGGRPPPRPAAAVRQPCGRARPAGVRRCLLRREADGRVVSRPAASSPNCACCGLRRAGSGWRAAALPPVWPPSTSASARPGQTRRRCPACRAATACRSEFYRRQIVLGLRDYARRCGFADGWWAAWAASTPRSPWPWPWRRWARTCACHHHAPGLVVRGLGERLGPLCQNLGLPCTPTPLATWWRSTPAVLPAPSAHRCKGWRWRTCRPASGARC